MNEFLTADWVERVDRLALGLEPLDAGRGTRVAHPIRVVFREEALGLSRPRVAAHDSCLHALLYEPGVEGRVALRFFEEDRATSLSAAMAGGSQRYVPRLISFPILAPAAAEAVNYRNRVRRPRLFPGAAYDVASGATGVRSRVLRNTAPVRWARVVARVNGVVVGRAHCDHQGEFLLLIAPAAGPVGDLVDPVAVRVDVFAPAVAPEPNPPNLASLDPLWDLPEEAAAALDPNDPDNDPVSAGEALPAGFTATSGRNLNLRLGRIHSETIGFNVP